MFRQEVFLSVYEGTRLRCFQFECTTESPMYYVSFMDVAAKTWSEFKSESEFSRLEYAIEYVE